MGRAETESDGRWRLGARAARAGATSGLVAGVAMGLVLQAGTELLPVLGALLGAPSLLRGWLVHLVISAGYGVLFAAIVALRPVARFLHPTGAYDYLFAGVVYAAMIIGAGFAGTIAVLPFVFELTGMTAAAQSPEIPGPALGGLIPAFAFAVAHVVYGAVLGVGYAYLGAPADARPVPE